MELAILRNVNGLHKPATAVPLTAEDGDSSFCEELILVFRILWLVRGMCHGVLMRTHGAFTAAAITIGRDQYLPVFYELNSL
jgi:hypothetical protein